MNSRLRHQLAKVERVLPLLERAHVPVYRVELDAQRPAPLLQTGTGPYAWVTIGYGCDNRGPWTDYSTWLYGVELIRRFRPHGRREDRP